MKIVAVNATALSSGGALTILKQFIDELKNNENNEFKFYVFLPELVITPDINNVIWIRTKNKSWFKRILWDFLFFKSSLKKMDVKPDLVISLQNTTINMDADQVIYLHQPLPFLNFKWNFFDKEERLLFLYSKFYSFFIFLYSKPSTQFVVQTEWMKTALINGFNIKKDKISVIKPSFSFVENTGNNLSTCNSKEYTLFYPASHNVYKNHKIIIDAIKIIKNEYNFNNVKFIVTFDETAFLKLKNYAALHSLESNLINVGVLTLDEVMMQYQQAHVVVFPSYIETFGLPLLESAVLNKKIICSDRPFSREILANYKNVQYVNYNDAKAWAKAIYDSKNKKVNSELFTYENGSSWDDFFKLLRDK